MFSSELKKGHSDLLDKKDAKGEMAQSVMG